MSLVAYRRKRDFKITREPRGKTSPAHKQLSFVVQKHAASRLHFDFRLEFEGVLKSWAVPKGPSLDPADKRLAVQVEDHPVEYGSFEGTIPKGQYGGGTVMLWDNGTWEPLEDPQAGMRKGRLRFALHGKRLKGAWSLVRMGGASGGNGKNWLLMKSDDKAARPGAPGPTDKDRSVKSKRTMEQIATGRSKVWNSSRESDTPTAERKASRAMGRRPAPKSSHRMPVSTTSSVARTTTHHRIPPANLAGAVRAEQPEFVSPQLATLVDDAPAGDQWLHEIKYDGYRVLAFKAGDKVHLMTRRGKNWTHRFDAVAQAVKSIRVRAAVFDGEVVVLAADGTSQFQLLQNQLKGQKGGRICYFVFDLLWCDGYDIRNAPLVERKALLRAIIGEPAKNDVVQYSEHVRGDGHKWRESACQMHLEGIVSKRADAAYVSARTRDWLKSKCMQRQEFVIAGYSDPGGSRHGFGSLLLGYYDGGKLYYCGRVGTGFNEASLRTLHKRLKSLAITEPAFVNPPRARDVKWVEPRLVAEVHFREWTDDDILRQPAFVGLREDRDPTDVRKERPLDIEDAAEDTENSEDQKMSARPSVKKSSPRKAKSIDEGSKVAGLTITHPDRILFEESPITKLDLAKYYEAIAPHILPYIAQRPLSLVRCPQGQKGKCFFQRHLSESLPSSIYGVSAGEGRARYVYIKDVEGLVALAQFGVLELHPWGCRVDDVDKPDQLIFDLDPDPAVKWRVVQRAAEDVGALLKEIGLSTVIKVTGGKGLHIIAPLQRRHTWDEVKSFAQNFAQQLAAAEPDRFVANMSKAKRTGRIYLDYLRNAKMATAVGPYSTRARPGAKVAAPIFWEELSNLKSASDFDVPNMLHRVARQKKDPWAEFEQMRRRLPTALFGTKPKKNGS